MLCGGPVATAVQRGSKLMFSSSSWHPSRRVRALIAVGLAIIGAVLVWAALARPSTPDSALAPAPNGDRHAVDVSQRDQAHPRTTYRSGSDRRSGPDHGVGFAGV